MLAKVFITFVVICVISICVFGVYFCESTEVTEYEYTRIQNYIIITPQIKAYVLKALQDGKISNHEFTQLTHRHKRLWFQDQKDRAKRLALDN